MMHDRKYTFLAILTSILLLPIKLFAFGAVLHYQGEVDDREAYFADLRVISNRTPADKLGGATEIKEIDVTAVYENPNKPEFVHMKLQFECPNAFSIDMTTHKLNENTKKVKVGDSVKFRIGSGSYKLRRSDLKSEQIPMSEWKTSNASMLSKAGAIACNSIEIDQALHSSIKGKEFDFDGFGQKISALGLPSDMMLLGYALPTDFLDFSWQSLWWEKYFAGDRPDPSGKWKKRISKAEKDAAIKKLEEMQNKMKPEIEAAQKSLLAGIKKSQAQMDAAKNLTNRPDGKKLAPIESNLLILWRGRPEKEIVDIMGNPAFNQAGDSRFLRYTKYWEKPGVTVIGGNGAVVGGEMGGYAECFVEFKTKPDGNGEWIVDDILVRSTYEGDGLGHTRGLCDALGREASR